MNNKIIIIIIIVYYARSSTEYMNTNAVRFFDLRGLYNDVMCIAADGSAAGPIRR